MFLHVPKRRTVPTQILKPGLQHRGHELSSQGLEAPRASKTAEARDIRRATSDTTDTRRQSSALPPSVVCGCALASCAARQPPSASPKPHALLRGRCRQPAGPGAFPGPCQPHNCHWRGKCVILFSRHRATLRSAAVTSGYWNLKPASCRQAQNGKGRESDMASRHPRARNGVRRSGMKCRRRMRRCAGSQISHGRQPHCPRERHFTAFAAAQAPAVTHASPAALRASVKAADVKGSDSRGLQGSRHPIPGRAGAARAGGRARQPLSSREVARSHPNIEIKSRRGKRASRTWVWAGSARWLSGTPATLRV